MDKYIKEAGEAMKIAYRKYMEAEPDTHEKKIALRHFEVMTSNFIVEWDEIQNK